MMDRHVPVLLQEVLEGLNIQKGDTIVDATLGGGGYTERFCVLAGDSGTVIGIDQDGQYVQEAQERFKEAACNTYFLAGNFRNIDILLKECGITQVQKVAFDLGLNSMQLAHSGRGFSFQNDEPLLMTMQETPSEKDITAKQIVNNWSEESIANVIYGYGEEQLARRIAKAIIEARKEGEITTTSQLKSIVESAVKRRGKIHPATRVFQALRIAVNDELQALEEGLQKAFTVLSPGGRIAVVSFHSLEDRIVKHFFKQLAQEEKAEVMTKKPIQPTDEEREQNPRSRSSKLRVIKKI